jgi:hypothetical protein
MKELFQVFDEKFVLMQKMASELNFRACLASTSEMIQVSITFEYKDGVFIGEVLEAIYEQTWRLLRDFILPEEDQNMLKAQYDKYLSIIASSYKEKDKNTLYDALLNLRFEITKAQFKCVQNYKRKEKQEPVWGR